MRRLARFMLFFASVILLSVGSLHADTTVRNAQQLLNRLGYNAGAVDGIVGGKTLGAMSLFYQSIGKDFDGSIDNKEVEELQSAIEAINDTNSSNFSKRHFTFPNRFIFANENKYRRIMHSTWKMPMRARNSSGVFEDANCYKIFESTNWRSGSSGCIAGIEWGLHSALFDDERMSRKNFNYAFEVFYPRVAAQNSYLNGRSNDLQYFRSMQSLYMGYALYSDIYGVSDELDEAMARHFDKFIKSAMDRDHKTSKKRCKKYFPATINEVLTKRRLEKYRQCSNSAAAEWIKLYVAMGIVSKRAEYIDEALVRLDSFIASTFEGGVIDQALRSGDAPGYLAQTMEHLDDIGFMFETYLGVNLWEYRAGGNWNNSFGDILSYSVRAFMDPSLNIEFAKVNDVLKGLDHYECCAGDENWKSAPGRNNDPVEIEKTINSYLLGTSWTLLKMKNKELLERIKPYRKNVVWRSFNTFPNKLVILQ